MGGWHQFNVVRTSEACWNDGQRSRLASRLATVFTSCDRSAPPNDRAHPAAYSPPPLFETMLLGRLLLGPYL